MPSLEIQEHVALAPYTTLGLGGPARWLIPCWDEQELIEAASWARQRELPMLVLGGGSNLVIPDAGFDGVVLHLRMQSLQIEMDSTGATITAEAGEPWDDLVRAAVERGLSGIECLSGIPGSTGATPIQNVGAYGQEVSETIQSVETLEITTLRKRTFSAADCKFGYRQSRFRRTDAGGYILLRVVFRLPWAKNPPRIRYSELERYLSETRSEALTQKGSTALRAVRDAVLALRKRKSMVVDPEDPHSKSAGSFFLNPVVSEEAFATLTDRWRAAGGAAVVPSFPARPGRKIPAAWLVEQAGFSRGYRLAGAGISANHALALVNYGGSTADLLALAAEIERGVQEKFGIELEREPVLVR